MENMQNEKINMCNKFKFAYLIMYIFLTWSNLLLSNWKLYIVSDDIDASI